MNNENTTTQPASVDSITVAASSAKVLIEYGDVSEISIQPNNPEEFEITNFDNKLAIKEKASSRISGVSMNNCIIGGNCSVVCTGGVFGLSQSIIGGKHIVKVNGLTITSSSGCQIVIDDDYISIDGQTIKTPRLFSTIEVKTDGIYVNGTAVEQSEKTTPAKPKERNELRITIPHNCQSFLQIIGSSDAEFTLPEWTSPKDLNVDLYSDAKLKAGSIKCHLVEASLGSDASATFDEIIAKGADLSAASDARITIKTLSTYALDIRTASDAKVEIKAGKTETGTARAASDSVIKLNGDFKNVRCQKASDAIIKIS